MKDAHEALNTHVGTQSQAVADLWSIRIFIDLPQRLLIVCIPGMCIYHMCFTTLMHPDRAPGLHSTLHAMLRFADCEHYYGLMEPQHCDMPVRVATGALRPGYKHCLFQ